MGMWMAVLVWSGRKPSPKFCATKDDLSVPELTNQNQGGGPLALSGDAVFNECMKIGEVLEIKQDGAVASLKKDSDDRAFIPGWSHQSVHTRAKFLVTSQGVELALKDLVAFYVDPKKKPPKQYKAVGCNVMVLKHGGKVEKNSKGSPKKSATDSGDSSDGLKKDKKKKRRDRRTSTKSGASSVGHAEEVDGAKVSKKAKAPAKEQKPRSVAYKELLLTAEIPEEDDNYDSDFDPPFIPPAIPDPDLDYDEYSDGEIPEDEVKELEKEGEAHLDVEDLRKKMMEAKLEADKAKAEAKEETGEGKDEKAAEAEVEKSKDAKDPA